MRQSKEIGIRGEDMAGEFLLQNGYTILERNVRTLFGEIDIVAKNKNTVAIVEVKSALVDRFSSPDFAPEIHVNEDKRQKLIKLGVFYMTRNKNLAENPWEIDIIAVEFNPFGLHEIRFWKQAVTQ